jgi:hypothetical protein
VARCKETNDDFAADHGPKDESRQTLDGQRAAEGAGQLLERISSIAAAVDEAGELSYSPKFWRKASRKVGRDHGKRFAMSQQARSVTNWRGYLLGGVQTGGAWRQ